MPEPKTMYCPTCNGLGYTPESRPWGYATRTCVRCDGRGRVVIRSTMPTEKLTHCELCALVAELEDEFAVGWRKQEIAKARNAAAATLAKEAPDA